MNDLPDNTSGLLHGRFQFRMSEEQHLVSRSEAEGVHALCLNGYFDPLLFVGNNHIYDTFELA